MAAEGDPEVIRPVGGDDSGVDCRLLRAGRAVQLFGLKSKAELNGLAGVVEEVLVGGRFRVRLLQLLHHDNGTGAGSSISDTTSSATDSADVHSLTGDPPPRQNPPPSVLVPTEVSVLAKNLVLYPPRHRDEQDRDSHEVGNKPAEGATTPPPPGRGTSSSTPIANKLAGLRLQARAGNNPKTAVIITATPSSLSRQLNAAPSRSILQLEPGVYEGPFMITKSVALVGGPGVVFTQPLNCASTLTILAPGVVELTGLDVRGPCTALTYSPGSASNGNGFHTMMVCSGTVVASRCIFSAGSGPAVVATNRTSALHLLDSTITGSEGGGLLVCRDAAVTATRVLVTRNAYCGVEVREGGEVEMNNCSLTDNRKQGLTVWCSGKRAELRDCEVSSHGGESGCLCADGEMMLRDCLVYDNWMGVAVQGGKADITGCKISGNYSQGVMVQAKGSCRLEKSEAFANMSHGVFVGFDSTGKVLIRGNYAHNNGGDGIFNGVPRSRKVMIKENKQKKNRGKPTIRSKLGDKITAQAQDIINAKKTGDDKALDKLWESTAASAGPVEYARWLKRMRKQGGGAAFWAAHFPTAEGARVPAEHQKKVQDAIDRQISANRACWGCGAVEDPALGKLLTCACCRKAVYCSKSCQKRHWKEGGHKGECQQHCEFPSAGDASRDVREWGTWVKIG